MAIMIPKLAHNFVVVGDEEWLKPITAQVVGIDLGAEDLSHDHIVHRSHRLVLWLEDDINGMMIRAIRQWQAIPVLPSAKTFTIKVKITNFDDPVGVLETYTFLGCELEALQHSMLSYAPRHDKISLAYTSPADGRKELLTGEIKPATASSAMMKLLQVSFTEMQHTFQS